MQVLKRFPFLKFGQNLKTSAMVIALAVSWDFWQTPLVPPVWTLLLCQAAYLLWGWRLFNLLVIPPLQLDKDLNSATHDAALAYARKRRAVQLAKRLLRHASILVKDAGRDHHQIQ